MCQDILNSELEKVPNWLMSNKPTVNIKTTNYVIFKVRQRQLPSVLFNIKNNNENFERKTHTKFLGVYVDEHLNWKDHVNLYANKVSKSIGIITKARFYLSMPSFRTLHLALLYPYLQYGTIVWWGSKNKTTLNRLIVLQKRIIRVITKSCFDAPSAPLLYEHNFLNITNIYMLHTGLFMFYFKKKLLPVGFHDMFLSSSQLHSCDTRNAI